jgi:N-acetylglucosaminylphosphatidylinositol deacetylase
MSFLWRILGALTHPKPTSSLDASYARKALIANTWGRYLKTRRAFGSHGSQYSWDRNLYMILSRYVWFNDLKEVQKIQS